MVGDDVGKTAGASVGLNVGSRSCDGVRVGNRVGARVGCMGMIEEKWWRVISEFHHRSKGQMRRVGRYLQQEWAPESALMWDLLLSGTVFEEVMSWDKVFMRLLLANKRKESCTMDETYTFCWKQGWEQGWNFIAWSWIQSLDIW